MKFIIRLIFNNFTYILGILVYKQKNLILMTGSNHESYNESTKYLFEYFTNKNEFHVYWVTNNIKVFKYLKKKK